MTLQQTPGKTEGIEIVQSYLKAVGHDINITGVFDQKTRLAVEEFQKKNKFPVSGKLDQGTLLCLNEAIQSSYLVFDRSDGYLYVYSDDHELQARFPAGNNTIRPEGDPYTVDSKGPAPNGEYPVQDPLYTADSPDKESYGSYFFPVGDCGESPSCTGSAAGDIARRRGIGVHAGRSGPESKTKGCVRVSENDIRDLHAIHRRDPIRKIVIKD